MRKAIKDRLAGGGVAGRGPEFRAELRETPVLHQEEHRDLTSREIDVGVAGEKHPRVSGSRQIRPLVRSGVGSVRPVSLAASAPCRSRWDPGPHGEVLHGLGSPLDSGQKHGAAV